MNSEEEFNVLYPARPWTTNAERASNRWHRAELVKEWREAFLLLTKAQNIPQLTKVHITAQPYQKSGRLADVAAHNPAVKAAIDGIVDAGVMEDDSPEHLLSITFLPPKKGRDALQITIRGERTER